MVKKYYNCFNALRIASSTLSDVSDLKIFCKTFSDAAFVKPSITSAARASSNACGCCATAKIFSHAFCEEMSNILPLKSTIIFCAVFSPKSPEGLAPTAVPRHEMLHPTVDWRNSIKIKASKYFDTELTVNMYYDKAQNSAVMIKSFLSLGLTYTFKNK